ncbi:hypothetical protein [Streptomyces scabiei]|uniref:hypothetical protein n=1 Tax=Streptomyces scabiei TaxID=1930 RepID=UPI0029A8BAB9|nr:hypothetical protein [Streptomyces scabiei]MDX3142260.1 hypothetical protein [Streptomyces scabiei]
MTPEEERDNALIELARLRAGLSAGLTPEQSARLQGSTDEELTADAQAFATELGLSDPPVPTSRSGGPRGGDVGNGAGTVSGGAERYRQKHPQRAPLSVPTEAEARRNPFQERTYTMSGR